MPRPPVPLTPDRAENVGAYFQRLLAIPAGVSCLQPDTGAVGLAYGELTTARQSDVANRPAVLDAWLRKWVTAEARQRCFVALRQAARSANHTPAPRRRVNDDAWELLTKLANDAEVSPQLALSGILDFILADPARHRAAERFLKARAQLTSHEEPKGAARR